jgi:hypothetical protein
MMKHAAGNPAFSDDQQGFIKNLGPYHKLALAQDQLEPFLNRIYTLWFFRWPLRKTDYYDEDFLQHDKGKKKKVFFALS